MVPLTDLSLISFIASFRVVRAGSCKGTVGASRLLGRNALIECVLIMPVEIVKLKLGVRFAYEGLNRKGAVLGGGITFLGRGTLEEFMAVNHVCP